MPPPGVRERKRRALRQKLSDTATMMFLTDGFDQVRVADVAKACGVSTKTVWNHFPTKESLLFDRGETLARVLQAATEEPTDVLGAVLSCIRTEVNQLQTAGPAGAMSDDSETVRMVRAFALLVGSNPTLRAATSDQLERLTQLAAAAIATQSGTGPYSPENQIVASALVSLWKVHLQALMQYADARTPLSEVQRAVMAEVERGAQVVRRLSRYMPTKPTRRTPGTRPIRVTRDRPGT